MYTRGPEVVEARALAHIRAEEGMWATVSAIRRAEEVFLAVEIARVKSNRSRGSRRKLIGSAYT
jgi:hypothetical protein